MLSMPTPTLTPFRAQTAARIFLEYYTDTFLVNSLYRYMTLTTLIVVKIQMRMLAILCLHKAVQQAEFALGDFSLSITIASPSARPGK